MRSILLVPVLLTASLPRIQDGEEPPKPAGADPPGAATLALFDYDREQSLDVQERGVQSFDGYERIDLTYASPAGGRVPAFLYQPLDEGPHAGLLLMHGMPGSRDSSAPFGAEYVRTGAVVLVISAPWARPDGPREDVLRFTEEDRAEQIQLIQDLRRGVDLLESFPWVDRERIGYVGGSYGGAMGGLLAGVEKRIRAFALAVGDGGLVAHLTGPDDGEGPPEGVGDEQWNAWLAHMRPIEPLRFVALAAPSELLFQNGRTDQLVPAADAEAYHAAASEPKTILWYDGGHGLTAQMRRDQVEWLAARIGIDAERYPGI